MLQTVLNWVCCAHRSIWINLYSVTDRMNSTIQNNVKKGTVVDNYCCIFDSEAFKVSLARQQSCQGSIYLSFVQ